MKGSHMNSNLSSDRTWTMTSVFVCVFLDLCLTGEQQNLNKTESATLFAPVPILLESVRFRLLITWTNKVTLLKHALRSVLRYMDENRIGLTWENVSSRSFIFTFHHCCDLACNAKVFSQVWLNLLLGKMNHLTWENILLVHLHSLSTTAVTLRVTLRYLASFGQWEAKFALRNI